MIDILAEFKKALSSLDSLYTRMIVLVNYPDAVKQEILNSYSDTALLNLNYQLSSRLLEYSQKQQALKVPEIISELLEAMPAVAFIHKLDILFDPLLKTDPLTLFRSISRNRSIIIFWEGSLKDDRLYYAQPPYPEYKSYPVQDFIAIAYEAQNHF